MMYFSLQFTALKRTACLLVLVSLVQFFFAAFESAAGADVIDQDSHHTSPHVESVDFPLASITGDSEDHSDDACDHCCLCHGHCHHSAITEDFSLTLARPSIPGTPSAVNQPSYRSYRIDRPPIA